MECSCLFKCGGLWNLAFVGNLGRRVIIYRKHSIPRRGIPLPMWNLFFSDKAIPKENPYICGKIQKMSAVKDIAIEAYDYPLPEDRIAKYPLPERDASKLLVLKDDRIQESQFKHIGDFLPEGALLVFNETKVIRARLQFHKATGSRIEVFCLEPEQDYQVAFAAASPVRWRCLIGNAKRWKEGPLTMELNVGGQPVTLTAQRIAQNDQYADIEFGWSPAAP